MKKEKVICSRAEKCEAICEHKTPHSKQEYMELDYNFKEIGKCYCTQWYICDLCDEEYTVRCVRVK